MTNFLNIYSRDIIIDAIRAKFARYDFQVTPKTFDKSNGQINKKAVKLIFLKLHLIQP